MASPWHRRSYGSGRDLSGASSGKVSYSRVAAKAHGFDAFQHGHLAKNLPFQKMNIIIHQYITISYCIINIYNISIRNSIKILEAYVSNCNLIDS